MSAKPQHLRLAVCLFPGVTISDFQGPVTLFGFLSRKRIEHPAMTSLYSEIPKYSITIEYLAATMDSIVPDAGPKLVPQRTYDELNSSAEQYDILLIPGGMPFLLLAISS
jgi:putative intracellular protease/amidase